MANEGNLQRLYRAVSGSYNDIGTYEEFKAKMSDQGSRARFYQAVSNDFDDIGSWDDFNAKLGYGASDQGARGAAGGTGSVSSPAPAAVPQASGKTAMFTDSWGKSPWEKLTQGRFAEHATAGAGKGRRSPAKPMTKAQMAAGLQQARMESDARFSAMRQGQRDSMKAIESSGPMAYRKRRLRQRGGGSGTRRAVKEHLEGGLPVESGRRVYDPATDRFKDTYLRADGGETFDSRESARDSKAVNSHVNAQVEQERIRRMYEQTLPGIVADVSADARAAAEGDMNRSMNSAGFSTAMALSDKYGNPMSAIGNSAKKEHYDMEKLVPQVISRLTPGQWELLVRGEKERTRAAYEQKRSELAALEKELASDNGMIPHAAYRKQKKAETLRAEVAYWGRLLNDRNYHENRVRWMIEDGVMGDFTQYSTPKSGLEFFGRKVLDTAMWAEKLGTPANVMDQARGIAMSEAARKHPVLNVAGMIAGMGLDPMNYAFMGTGSLLGKGALWGVGRLASRGGATGAVATRVGGGTLAGKAIGSAVSSAATFAQYEAGQELAAQAVYDDWDLGKVLNSGVRGGLLGAAMGVAAPLVGNVSTRLVENTASTAGKVAVRTSQAVVSPVLEGTIFSVPEWIEGKQDAFDVWTGNMGMVLGFKAAHMVKSAPRSVPERLGELRQALGGKGRQGFAEYVRGRMNGVGRDMGFTREEREELREYGYGGLADLFSRSGAEKPAEASVENPGAMDHQRVQAERTAHPELEGYEAMEQLMGDGRVSQAARAKAYWMLTGRHLPVGTVMAWDRKENADGSVSVRTYSADGEVVTARRFGSGQQARGYERDVVRQVELNTVDMAEKYAEGRARSAVMEAACEDVARRHGLEARDVYDLYARQKEGEATPEQAEILHELEEALATHAPEGEALRPGSVRERIKQEKGVDIDALIRKGDGRTPEQEGELAWYVRELTGTPLEKEAASERRRLGQAQAQEARQRGAEVWERQEQGDETAQREMEDIARRMEEAEALVEDVFGPEAEYYIARMREDPWELVDDPSLSGDQQDAVLGYVNASSVLEGVLQASEESAGGRREQARQEVERRVHRDSGLVVPATMKVDDRQVYVVKGNVVMFDDGSGVDARNSSESVVVMDARTGEYEFTSPEQIFTVGESIEAQAELEAAYAAIEAEREASLGPVREKDVTLRQKAHADGEGPEQDNDGVSGGDDGGRVAADPAGEIQGHSDRGDIRVYEEGLAAQPNGDSGDSPRTRRNSETERLVRDLQYGEGPEKDNADNSGNDGGRMAADPAGSVEGDRDRSDIRVYEEGLGSPHDAHTDDSPRTRRVSETERLVGIAKANEQYWTRQETRALGERVDKTSGESDVYINAEQKKVYKVKDPYAKSPMKGGVQPEDAIYEHLVHNKYFPETAYRFEGISEDVTGGLRIVLSQEFVESASHATDEEVAAALAEKGLFPEGKYTYGNDEVSVTDVTGDNALVGADGRVYFIDPVIDFKRPAREILGDGPAGPTPVPDGPEGTSPDGNSTGMAGTEAPEGGETPLGRIPVVDGRPDFTAVEPESGWDGLVEAMESEDDAQAWAEGMVKASERQMRAAEKDFTRISPDPADMEGFKRARRLGREKIEQARRQSERWKEIAVIRQRRAEAAAALQARRQAEERRQRDAIAHDEAVARFEEEQRIKAQKQAEQERIGVHAVNPKIKDKWDAALKVEGNADAITLPDGSTLTGRYVLTEAGAATPSHDVNNAYQPTEGFPIDENGQSVNDRDYMRDKDAQQIVEGIARSYDNRALQDPVIVSRDGVVLSGNNRTMSGDLAAGRGTDKAYVDYLSKFGHRKYGFTPEQVAGMKNPRVVFVPDQALPYDAATFARFNAQEKKSQGKPEAAVKLGKVVPDNVFNSIVNDISRYDRLSDYYADEKAVAHALGTLMRAGVINDKQLPEMRTGTALSAAGRELIENTLIGKVFQASPDAVRQIISVPTLRQSIVMGLNEIANNRTLSNSGYDLADELAKAVDLVQRAKVSSPDIYVEGMPVSPFGRMAGLFDDEFGDSRVTDATTLLLADILNSGKPSDLRKVLAAYNNEAASSASGQADIFTGEVATKEDILTTVNEHFRNATPKEQQALVDNAIAERKRRAAEEQQQRRGGEAGEQTADALQRGSEPQQLNEPTEAQKAAGNYKMGHRRVDGYNISIENAKGSVRRGTGADGKPWETLMQNDYGYIRGTEGVDGDHIDVFLSDTPEEGDVFVVDQVREDGSFDEHKVMYGFPTEQAARDAYLSNYELGWTGLGAITHVGKDEFKKWIQSSRRKTKPFAEYKSVKVYKEQNPNIAIEPDGFGDFGPIFTQFKGDAQGGIKVLSELQDGEAIGALHHKDIGDIDLVWGNAGTGKSDGFGLAKLVKFHSEVVEHLQEILDDMHIVKRSENRINLESDTHKAAVRLTWNKEKKKWLLTAFEKRETSESIGKTTDTDDNPSDLRGDTALSQNSDVSDGKVNALSADKQAEGAESSDRYTITPTTYTNKKGKTSDVWLVKPTGELSKEEKSALDSFTREPLTEGKKTSRGWHDRKEGGYMMRSEEAAKALADMIGNEEAVQDAQPMTAYELREAVAASRTRNSKPKKAPINRVSLEDVMTDLSEKGETKLSDHAEPIKRRDPLTEDAIETLAKWDMKPTHQLAYSRLARHYDISYIRAERILREIEEIQKAEAQYEISDDEMASLADELRDLLGIGEDEGDSSIRFRDPGELTPQERQRIQSAGIRLAMGLIERGTTAFPDYATKMVGLLGDKIRPWLKSFYEGARWTPGYDKYTFTPTEQVATFDVQNFDKKHADPIAQAAMMVEERKAGAASAQAQKELTETRNKNRRENDKQTEADTAALAEKADAVAGEAKATAQSAGTGEAGRKRILRDLRRVDETLEEVNDQLALLGYYEAEEVGKDFNEAYGYMRNAEKKAVKDTVDLAKRLVNDLGLELDKVTGSTTANRSKKRTAVSANIAPAGGDISIRLPINEGRELYITIGLDPSVTPGDVTYSGDNLQATRIMYRVEWPDEKGRVSFDRMGRNCWADANVTYTDLLNGIQREAKDFLPESSAEKPVDMAERGESPYTVAPEVEAQLAEQSKAEETHNGYKVGDEVMWDRYGNGKWEKVKIEDFDADGSPIFEAVKGVMSEKGDWSRVKPADGIFGEAQRVARSTQEKKTPATPAKKKTAVKPEQQVGDLLGGLFDEPISITTDEKKTDVQSRPGTAERERGHQPQPNDTLGESQRNEVKGTDGRGMDRRGSVNPLSDRERGAGVPRNPKSKPVIEPLPESERKNVRNNHAERGVDYAPKGEDARIKANVEAIELAKRLLDAGETATPEQMAILRKFSGWGGLGKAFNEQGHTPNPTARRLRELLGEEGYQDAVDSRRSAYYTPAEVIDTMWDVARAMGFKGGNVLEGSAGIGNIIGLMPADMSERSSIHAVEIDRTTGGILSLLYPDAKVEIQGFEKTRVQNGSVDLAITNVPFITGAKVFDETGDKDLSRKFRDIHDFCIAKNIRKLREGGIGIFITSSGTMDNSKELRRWITSEGNADVVGAFRMHNKTFGGTGATSDIIVVRKRVNGKPSPNAIDVTDVTGVRVADYDTGETRKVKGQEIPVIKQYSMMYNKYFAEHPENMAGEMMFNFERGETRFPTSRALFPAKGKEQPKMLAEWAGSFTDMEEEASTPKIEDEVTRINERLGEGVKEGSMVLNSQGELCMARMGEAVPLGLNKNKVKGHTKAECFKAYSAIKKALSDVLEYQSSHEGDEGLAPLLKELNRAFDTFTRTYGNLHKNTAISFLRNDVDFSSILALETYSEKGDKKGDKVIKVGKTDIFSRRVIDTEKEPQPTTVKDAILASLYKSGGVDVEYIGQALGKPTEEVKREIVSSGLGFENPSTGTMEVSYKYLSGNVREKLHIAQENNADGRYEANIKALEGVMPMTIPAHLIEFSLGSSWIEPKLYEDFVFEKTGLRVTLTNAGGTWFMKTPWSTFNEKNRAMAVVSKMCDKTIMGHELIEAAITNRQITVSKTEKHYDGSTETITDKAATAECGTKVDEIRAEFKDWAREHMQADPAMSARIEQTYNDQFNNYVPMSIPDEFVPQHFGGQVSELHGHPFALRPHQGRAVVRGTTEPILLAHEVGTGKTYTLITTAMEMRRLGTARKPMIVVQNATVGQFVESAKEIYPNAKVLTIEEADRTAEGRKNFYAKIKYNDWDMVVVPQSVFERIPDSEEREMAYVKDIIEEKMKVLEAMREADSDGRSMIVRQAERELAEQEARLAELTETMQGKKKKRDEKREATTRQNAQVRALEMLDREVDDVENFDDMGIDAILVDEAHEYKHLGFATAMQRGVKGVDPSYSKKSQGVFLKAQAVMERNNGRNVVFATGTPISNTAAEIWTFMRYLMPTDTMKSYGIYYFDDFVRNFGNIAQMVEFSTNGKFKENNRFAGYVNLPELVRIWSSVADTVLTREAGGVSDKIPSMEGGKPQDIYLPQTRALRSVMKYVKAELDRYDKMTGKEKKENSHIPLTMYGIAKAAAVDVRLVVPNAEDDPNSKTNATVRETVRSLHDSEKYKGTVAIFSDNYQNKQSGFNLYEDIRKKLITEGVPAEQIVVIKPGMTIKRKLDIFEKVNAGEIRVIMGSTFTLGTGVNIQERLHTLIHVDAPNRPMDYTQRNGRALRQGNLHKDMGIPVRIIRFGVEDSLDVTAYQRLKTKGAIADSIMNGSKMMKNSMENRVLEEEEDVFGDMTAQLSGSEYAILKNQAEREVRNLTAKQKGHDVDQIYVHNQLPKVEGLIKGAERRIEIETRNLETIGRHFPDGTLKKITVGKHTFGSVAAMEDFFKEQNAKMNEAAENVREGADNYTSKLVVDVDGLKFEVTTTVSRTVDSKGQGTLTFEPERNVTYSCDELGIKDQAIKGNRLKNIMQKIAEDIVTGRESRELLGRGQQQLAHYTEERAQLEQRSGREFPYRQQLAEAKERLAKYEEAMKKELAEKEAKYAEMDKSVETASDITLTDEDSAEAPTTGDGNRYRDGEEMGEGERLRAIRALEPIEVKRNEMSRAELFSEYRALPDVMKDGNRVQFLRTAFGKNYKEGGLFAQVVPQLDELLSSSVLAYSDKDAYGGSLRPDGTVHKTHPNVASFDNYVNKAKIGGQEYYVRMTVQNTIDNTTGLHSCFVSNVDVYEKPAIGATDSAILRRPKQPYDGIVDAKLQQFFERASSEALELDKADRVRELSERLNTEIRIVTDRSGIDNLPSARHRRAKGFFDPSTGEVVIVVPNNRDVADVDNTFVHEVVGHKGLRALIGEERLDEFLGEVYGHAANPIRKVIDKMTDDRVSAEADRLRVRKAQAHERAGEDVGANYYTDMAEARVEAEKKREEFRREATEEYMSDLGGRIGSEGFEKMSREELTLWGRIKAKVQTFLDKFLRGLRIAKSIRLTDKDLAYILFKSWKNLRERQGKGDVFAEAEDAVMRRRTGWDSGRLREMTESEKDQTRREATADRIEELFEQAVAGDLTGKPVEVGKLTKEGKDYLERLSGIKMKEDVSFVLNPSDLVHVYKDHFGDNEKDKGNNIPLDAEDIRAISEVVSRPERVVFGKEPEGLHRNLFYFLSSAKEGTYNLLKIYSDRKGNLTAKTFYKTRKAVSQRVLSLMQSEHLTSVTDGASLSESAKLPKFFEYPKSEDENGLRFRDGDLGLDEYITKMKAEAMRANTDSLQAKREAMRAIGGNLNHLRQAMARQREYDITTVKSVSDLARILMDQGLLDDLSKLEVKRLLSAVKDVVGRQDVGGHVQKVMDIMVNNQLRRAADAFGRLLAMKGNRVDSRGIQVQGRLDPDGQRVAQVVRKSTTLPKDDIDNRIAEAADRMSSADQAAADEATIEYAGLQIARRYVEDITESKAEEKALRDSIKEAKEAKDAGHMSDEAYRQYVESTEDAIRQNRIERAEAYESLAERMGDMLGASAERARAWREAQRERVREIQHNANSDMEGRACDEHHRESRTQKFANNSLARFLMAPLGTFDQMLRMFGRKSTRGEGYLWNRFMRGWVEATEQEYLGYREALRILDSKASEVFGKRMTWGSLFGIDRRLPTGTVRFMDGGEMKDHEVSQGSLLYIYMADKMSDGRMKLRRMGITQEDVEAIKGFLDPRFLELADWMQEEFLVDRRNKYNEVHKRMFGASMAAIENYFPLKILSNARTEDVDVAEPEAGSQLPSTSTGSIIKRRRNSLALDVTGANAFSVILDHLQQMERWSAFAEFNRDLNTLLSYKRFRNQVMHMSSAYGGGKTLWNNFRNVCRLAAGAYRPPVAPLDKAAVNLAKGVTAAKVSFRMFTALKQFLSMPAYVSDSNPVYLAANIANPAGAWRWSMANLPLFEKRWRSRMAGDPRLMKTEMDWKMWRSRVVELASRVGMSPNAFVDALTVAIGARSMYQTKLAKYRRQGYEPEDAERRARQDATILFNQTQQSSEGAFLSTMQVDRSWLSVLFTVFRNSSMSYTRQLYDSLRNMGRRLTPGYKALSEEFMAKQMRRDGIDPDKAESNARQEYRRGVIRDLVRVGVFGCALQLAWNLGAYLPYLIFGDDEEEKDKMWDDVVSHTMFGSIEGLTGGDVYSNVLNTIAKGEKVTGWTAAKDMPLSSDIEAIWTKWDKDEQSAVNDVINLLVQSGIGVNPQSLTDAAVAILDACGDDAASSRELALLITRILNCPQSQLDKIYLDELELTGTEAGRMTPRELAERYAEYKMLREAPLTGWIRTGEAAEKTRGSKEKKVLDEARGRIERRTGTEQVRALLAEADAFAKRERELNVLKKTDAAAYREGRAALRREHDPTLMHRVRRYKRDMKELYEQYIGASTPKEAQEAVELMISTRDKLLEDVGTRVAGE